jgi:tellurite resistance-related uncharacterized protein
VADDLAAIELPAGLRLARTTPEFTAERVPAGLLDAHQVAEEVWGVLRVLEGTVVFVVEASGRRRELMKGDSQVIEPGVPHHVEPANDARFVVEFHRGPDVSRR